MVVKKTKIGKMESLKKLLKRLEAANEQIKETIKNTDNFMIQRKVDMITYSYELQTKLNR